MTFDLPTWIVMLVPVAVSYVVDALRQANMPVRFVPILAAVLGAVATAVALAMAHASMDTMATGVLWGLAGPDFWHRNVTNKVGMTHPDKPARKLRAAKRNAVVPPPPGAKPSPLKPKP